MASVSRTIYAVLLSCAGREATGIVQEIYTQNAICRPNSCTNPIFPGMNDMPRLEQITWQCDPTQGTIRSYLNFCKNAVLYEPALPSPNSSQVELAKLIQSQDNAASTMFFYHLSGLGYEGWEYTKPEHSPDPCVRATWRLVCNTYFPKAQTGCQPQAKVPYLRPCQTACSNYVQACKVECCDESPQCVFTHTIESAGTTFLQTGYVAEEAPSAQCTGMGQQSSGQRSTKPMPLLALLLGIAGVHLAALGGSGASVGRPSRIRSWRLGKWTLACGLAAMPIPSYAFDLPQHSVGNWRQGPDYLRSYAFVNKALPTHTFLNSCGQSGIPVTQQCSGQGYCKAWDSAPGSSSFCYCNSDFADPECRTRRKSQTSVFFLSLFGGFLGLDYLYLGLPLVAASKACTLGGLGIWWLVDIIRTGSGPVYAYNYRVAPDLSKFVFVLSTVSLFIIGSFIFSMLSYFRHRAKKRRDVMMLMQSEEAHVLEANEAARLGPQFGSAGPDFKGPRRFTGYGATLPTSLPNADAPYAQGQFAGPYGPVDGPVKYD